MSEENPFASLRQGDQTDQNPFAVLKTTPSTGGSTFEPAAEEDGEKPSIVGEFAKGVVSAPVQIFRGLTELGALGIDAAFDTNYVQEVSDVYDVAEEFIGRPETRGGEITRDLVAFGVGFIPIAGWLGRAGLVAKTGKPLGHSSKFMKSAEEFGLSATGKALLGNRAKVLGTTTLAGGVYDGLISSDGRSTLSDSFSFLPDFLETEQDTGLEGNDEAYRQLRNRLRQVGESAALGATFDAALFGLGRGSQIAGELPVIGDALSATARGVMKGWETTGSVLGLVPGVQPTKQTLRRYFSPGGGVDPNLQAAVANFEGMRYAQSDTVARSIFNYINVSEKLAKLSARRANRTDMLNRINADVNKYIDRPVGSFLADNYGQEIQDAADDLIRLGTEVEDIMASTAETIAREAPTVSGVSGIPSGLIAKGTQKKAAEALLETIRANKLAEKTHLTRIYQLHADPEALYKSLGGKNLMDDPKFKAAEEDLVRPRLLKGGDENLVRASVRRTLLNTLGLRPVGDNLTPDAIEKAIQGRLNQVKKEALGEGGSVISRDTPIFKLQRGLLQERTPITEVASVRALLGEITNPAERMGFMLDTMLEMNSSLRFYQQQSRGVVDAATGIRKLAEGGRPMYVYMPNSAKSANPEAELADLTFAMGYGAPTANLTSDAAETLMQYGYVKLGDENLDDIFGGQFGPLSGMYVPQEVREALTAPIQLGTNPWSQLGAIVQQAKGLTQKMTIIPSIPSRARDIVGSKMMIVGSGNATSGFGQTDGEQFLTVYRMVRGLDQEGTEAMARKIALSGAGDSSVVLNALRSIQKEGPDFSVSGKFKRGIENIETKTPLLAPMLSAFEDVTKATDILAKSRVLLSEEAKLRDLVGSVARGADDQDFLLGWMQRSGVIDRTKTELDLLDTRISRITDDQLSEMNTSELLRLFPDDQKQSLSSLSKDDLIARHKDQLVEREKGSIVGFGLRGDAKRTLDGFEVAAADRTRKFMPTHSEVGKAVRGFDRFSPFGAFTSFASETIRNTSNILEQGLKELSTVVDDELIEAIGQQAAERFVRSIRGHGAQRLTGLLAVSTILPKAMVRAGQEATEMTDEQMDRLHEQADFFQKGQDIVPIEFDGEGKIKYLNLSYVMPYSFITDSAQAALRGYEERGRLNKNEAEQIAGGVFDMIGALADPFASEAIIYERVRDALPSSGFASLGIGRGGQTSTGAKVYEPTDSLGDRVSQGFLHVVDAVTPAIGRELYGFDKGELKEGKLTRAMLGIPGARGQEYNVYEELGRQITGFTPTEINLKRDAEFAASAYAPKRSNAKQIANRVIKASDSTLPEIYQGWNDYLDGLYRIQSELYNEIQGMRELGLSDAEIRRNFVKKANLGSKEVNTIMRGQFYPGLVSSEIRKEVIMQTAVEDRARIVQQVPWSELNRFSNERRGEPLSPELFRIRREDMANDTSTRIRRIMGLEEDVPDYSEFAQSPAQTAPLVPVQASAPTPQAPSAPAAPQPAPVATNNPNPEMLGSNPFEQLKNLQLFERLRQGQ